jgi:hypothetical protein
MFGENAGGLIMLSRHVVMRYEFSGHVDNALEELSNDAKSHSNLFERRLQRGSLHPAPKPSGLGMVSSSTPSAASRKFGATGKIDAYGIRARWH